jgi:hypothetical protein
MKGTRTLIAIFYNITLSQLLVHAIAKRAPARITDFAANRKPPLGLGENWTLSTPSAVSLVSARLSACRSAA